MGFSDIPAESEAKQILAQLDQQSERLDNFADAINGIGMNMQWLVDNVKHIFEMFGDPRFMSMLPKMMNPAGMQAAAKEMEGSDVGTESAAAESKSGGYL